MVDLFQSLPVGPFHVLYADPPWAYRKAPLVDRGRARAVEKEYATVSIEHLAALPVRGVAAPDAVMFMWATGPKMPQALALLEAWGFTYRTIAFVWNKLTIHGLPAFGMGFYTRSGAELCLVATKGRGLPRKSASVRQRVDAPALRHSEKPVEVRTRIEQLYDGSKLELFARATSPGWTSWGNEVTT